jgi:light-regulated signal transduction histidine kinase (bacteriophytochrome)
MWKETVEGRAIPFSRSEIEAAADLRNSIIGVVLRQAEETAELSGALERSNKELEAFSYSVSHDLRAPFRHIVGYAELLRASLQDRASPDERRYIESIAESAVQAGKLVDNLLSFSRMGRQKLDMNSVDLGTLVLEVHRNLKDEVAGRDITWRIDPLPTIHCDVMMMRLAIQNLLANAVKFTRMRPVAVIEIGVETLDDEYVFHVRDNGIGFDMKYADKLFGVFQRMHRMEDFEGTGIGLANVRRIIARHGGRTWADAAIDRGATFFFTLPKTP